MLNQQLLLKEELLVDVTKLQEEVSRLREENEELREAEVEAMEERKELALRLQELEETIRERDFFKEEKVKADEWAEQVDFRLKKQQELLDNYSTLLEKQQIRLKLKEESNQKLLFELKTASDIRFQLQSRCNQLEAEEYSYKSALKQLEEEKNRLEEEKISLEERLQDSVPIAQCTDMQTRILELEGLVSTNDSLNPSVRKGRSYSALSFSSPLISPSSEQGLERLLTLLQARNVGEACDRVELLTRKSHHLERCRRLYERLRASMSHSDEHVSTLHVLHWYLTANTERNHYRAKQLKSAEIFHQMKALLGVPRSVDIPAAIRRLISA
jgi:chromosome segregation ATPase